LGAQVIFQNGDYDGFSIKEQILFLEDVGFIRKYSEYVFKNVIKVSEDFEKGYWGDIWKQ